MKRANLPALRITANLTLKTSKHNVPDSELPACINLTLTNAFQYSMPPYSVTTIVLEP